MLLRTAKRSSFLRMSGTTDMEDVLVVLILTALVGFVVWYVSKL